MAQVWHDLLFAHYPVKPAALRDLIPPGLAIDTYAGEAWVSVVPFRMSGIRPRRLVAVPRLSAFPELNARTYVVAGDYPGVWFFSLDAGNRLAVAIARRWYHLPYFFARMSVVARNNRFDYASERADRGAPPAAFAASYRPTGPPAPAPPGSLDWWLVERYCLYAADRRGTLHRAVIDHPPWPLQPAEAEIRRDTLAAAAGIALPATAPRLHFAARQEVVAWAPRPLDPKEIAQA